MKAIIVIFSTILFTLPQGRTPWIHGQYLNVFAESGLKLRAFPNLQSEVLDIVRYGDRVKVINTFDFADDKADRIDWIDGHWILVEYEGEAGYLFDGYLSDLSFPGSEEEICTDGYSFAFTLTEYIKQHFHKVDVVDSSSHHRVDLYDCGIKVRLSSNADFQKVEIEMPDTGIHEILNLMRSMVVSKAARIQFENSLVFIEGLDGKIEKIKVNLGDPVMLQIGKNGHLKITASGYAGC